ncbi:peptidoglycan-binding protein [Actinomadura macra]|uniref:peptidoglycan-binding protein n=1 Tax=Actinomadura macra TaxID=46164 RepID=UPI00083384F8|nr:peptidoglycan-binding protein [Actinomadura macra]
MGTAAAMLAEARKSLGMSGRPNKITREYAARHGNEFAAASWCDMAVTFWARHSGNADAVLPGGDRAYTVWHAQDFQKAGRWHVGTVAEVDRAKPGDVVFFDWNATNSVAAIDHVGVVERVLGGGRLQTIEANTSDACRRRVRSASVIAGYGRPAYDAAPVGSHPTPAAAPRWPGRYLTQPPTMLGDDVRTWQARMRARGWHLDVDGRYGPGSETVCRAFQAEKRLGVDGVVGPATWAAAWTAPLT